MDGSIPDKLGEKRGVPAAAGYARSDRLLSFRQPEAARMATRSGVVQGDVACLKFPFGELAELVGN